MTVSALRVRGLQKTFPSGFTALDGLDLDIPDGALFGLLGPNGAGKSTLIGSVCNLVRPTAGEISVFGHDHDSRRARQLVGLAEQDVNLDRFLSNAEVLIYHGGYYGLGTREARHRAHELLELFGLEHKSTARPRDLSGGMLRRLLVARALMHRPRLLILDEPTAGVDVELRSTLWEYMRQLHSKGHTVLLTTHYLEEAQELCDVIGLIRGGRIVGNDNADVLRERYGAADLSEVYSRTMLSGAANG